MLTRIQSQISNLYTWVTVAKTTSSDPDIAKINFHLQQFQAKVNSLEKETSDVLANRKHIIMKKVTDDIQNAIDTFNKADASNTAISKQILIQQLADIIKSLITQNADSATAVMPLRTLMIKRNNNQYIANFAWSAGLFATSALVATACPENIFAYIFYFMGTFQYVDNVTHDRWENYMPASVNLIYNLSKSLSEMAIRNVSQDNYYTMLGVERTASTADISKAYRILAKVHHPDSVNGDEETFKKLVQIKDTLCDKDKRALYDQTLDKAQDYTQALSRV